MNRGKSPIGGKHLNAGIRLGLCDKKHYDVMGDAIWLFFWMVGRQTTQRDGQGLVLRGKPLTYRDISEDTGFPERTLQRWMATLIGAGYIQVKYSSYKRMVIRVLNAKKFSQKQTDLFRDFHRSHRLSTGSYPPGVADIHTKSGGFKERIKIEHKKKEAAAVPSHPSLKRLPGSRALSFPILRELAAMPRPMMQAQMLAERNRQLDAFRVKFHTEATS